MKNSLLDHLPVLPAIDRPTQALFEAIWRRDAEGVQLALTEGARLDQTEPFRLGTDKNDIQGGLLPLQAACSISPQKPLAVDVMSVLLAHGADADATGIDDDTAAPLAILAQRLPQNAGKGVALLAQHGASPKIEMILLALQAQHSWADWRTPVHYLETTLEALWTIMPEQEQQKLTPEWIMRIVPDSSVPLDYAQIKKVQWLSNHCHLSVGMQPATQSGELDGNDQPTLAARRARLH